MKRMRSEAFFARAQKLMPGGVNSPVRNFGRVGGHPVFMARGKGAKVYDADGNEYIDYLGSWGPLILGHSHPWAPASVRRQRRNSSWRNSSKKPILPLIWYVWSIPGRKRP